MKCQCGRQVVARQLCGRCYMAARRSGMEVLPTPSLAERLWRRVRESESGCWEWTGAIQSSGYGHIKTDNGMTLVHRLVYEMTIATIPAGLEIDHLCRNRICVRPDHLEAVTGEENRQRMLRARQPASHCKRGHSLSGDNVLPGNRCKTCRRASQLAHKRRLTEARDLLLEQHP